MELHHPNGNIKTKEVKIVTQTVPAGNATRLMNYKTNLVLISMFQQSAQLRF
jgi:hypothetical protein